MIVQSRCQFHTRREGRPTSSHANMAPSFDDRYWRAPCKGGAFQWVQVPPGERSSRKQPEQSWR